MVVAQTADNSSQRPGSRIDSMSINRADRGAGTATRQPNPSAAAVRSVALVVVFAAASAAAALSLLSLAGTSAAFTVRATTPPIEVIAPAPTASASPTAPAEPTPPAADPSPSAPVSPASSPQQEEGAGARPSPQESSGVPQDAPFEGDGQGRSPRSPHGGLSSSDPDASTAREPRGGDFAQE
ncbi:hypothetical protein GCM10022630_44610 [Thermobifida alba]